MVIMEIKPNDVNPVALYNLVPAKASSHVLPVNELAEKVASIAPEENASSINPYEVGQRQSLQGAVAQINDYMQNVERSLVFSIDEDSGRDVVIVLDKKTEEVIRQFPSEEVLVIARRIAEQQDDVVSLFSSQV
jgi:flagellar protein FlaG